MKVYASISGGKDSLTALITHMERGGQCDGAIYCRIMFDDETSAEVPEHEEWLHSTGNQPRGGSQNGGSHARHERRKSAPSYRGGEIKEE